jgi:hypothetical protein
MAKRDVARTSESPFRIENRSVHIRWKKLVDDFLSRGKSSKDAVECCFAGRIHILEDKLVIRVRLAAIPTEEDGKTDFRVVATERAVDDDGEGYVGVSDISDCLHLDFGKIQRYLYSKGMPDECYLSKVVRNGVVEQYRIICDK